MKWSKESGEGASPLPRKKGELKMTDMVKDNLCVKCALLKKVDKDGYITCPCFTNKQARAEGMNVFLHCFCTDCVRKEK